MRKAVAPCDADHLIGNVHANHAALGNHPGKAAREPARAATDIQHIVGRPELHLSEDRQRDRQVIPLHALAAPGFRPSIKLFPQGIVLTDVSHFLTL